MNNKDKTKYNIAYRHVHLMLGQHLSHAWTTCALRNELNILLDRQRKVFMQKADAQKANTHQATLFKSATHVKSVQLKSSSKIKQLRE